MEEHTASGTALAVTTFGPGGPLARTSGGRTLLYTPDASGNVSQQLDAATGAVVASYAFDAWGGRSVATSDPTAALDPYAGYGGMHGYYTDPETGLQLCGLRYYDSAAGRWLNRDPISYTGGMNLYGYCGNGALGASDASGMFGWGDVFGSCLSAIVLLAAIEKLASDTAGSIDCGPLCSSVAACLGSLPGLIGAPGWLGCVAGLIAGIIHGIADYICNTYLSPCNVKSFGCYVMQALFSTLAGCFGGWLDSSILNEFED